jgi:DNA-binding response OmpR family regulator
MDPEPVIVVADDDADILNLVVRRLGRRGWNVVGAVDGEEAIEKVRALRPVAVVLDWMMPKHTGPEVCEVLKSDPGTASIPIVLVTARASGGDRDTGIGRGADDYITKPFEIDVLDAVLKRLTGL